MMKINHTPHPWSLGVHGLIMNDTFDHVVARVLNDCVDEELILLAPTAPHDCDIPGCPGRENKRKLEAAEDLCVEAKQAVSVLRAEYMNNAANDLESAVREYEGKEKL